MHHVRLYAKDRKDNECEIVIDCHCHALPRVAWVFAGVTIRIDRARHAGWIKYPWRAGTHHNLQVIVICLGKRLVVVESNYDAARLILDGRYACGIDLIIIAFATAQSAVRIKVGTINHIIIPGAGITHTEACGVLDDQPGKEKPGEFEHAYEDQKQKGQYQRKFNHALRFSASRRTSVSWGE